jgi:predicted phosphodiesterase
MAVHNGKIDIAREYMEKYIALGIKHNRGYSKKYIGKVLCNEHPDLFRDEEEGRLYVRYATNAGGKKNLSKKSIDLERRFALIGEPYMELPNPEPFVIPKQYKNPLIIADLHSKFYDRKALELAINYGIDRSCDSVIINGDFMDFYGYSKFDKGLLTIEGFNDEREWGVDILQLLQDCFGKVFLKKGNHDIRREMAHQRLAIREKEVKDLVNYDNYLFFDGSTVNIIQAYQHIILGKLNIIHGHEFQGGNGIHVAYNRLNKTMDNVLSAHSHVSKSDSRPDINGNIFGSWVIGCLCSLHPAYNPKNWWNHGFARVEVDKVGEFEVHNRRILNNRSIPA